MDKLLVLQRWMEENERDPTWITHKAGRTREYISSVVRGHRPLSDKLGQILTERIGIRFPTRK